jgi:apolipoprotein N-acyltransferase
MAKIEDPTANINTKKFMRNRFKLFDPQNHILLLSFLSALLLILCFPGFSRGFLAWIALVPFLLIVHGAASRFPVVVAGFVTGIIFFGISLHWFLHVHLWAWAGVTCIEACFFALFAWLVCEARHFKSPLTRILWTAMSWTTVELLRTEMPIFGLGWNLLAFSQSENLPVLQFASWFGAYGLGFVIAGVNGCVYEILNSLQWIILSFGPQFDERGGVRALLWNRSKRVVGIIGLLLLINLIVFLLIWFGRMRLMAAPESPVQSVRVATVQGNIPQEIKWNTSVREKILEIHCKLTELAQYEQPDLAIWPEASFPGYLNRDSLSTTVFDLAKRLELPLLVGSCHHESLDGVYNSAYLIDGHGDILGRYDKQYLVPFGEYVPIKKIFGWLQPVADDLGISDFKHGDHPVIFKMPNENIKFSVLICFEDVFPNLARNAADLGAQWFAVMTNDAWFGPTAEGRQHLQASVFRAVENGVPIVRSANTGVSAFVSSKGFVYDRVEDHEGQDIFVTGKRTAAIAVSNQSTFYRQTGWVFPYVMAALFLLLLLVIKFGAVWREVLRTFHRRHLLVTFLTFFLAVLSSGCIRLAGTAGYAYTKSGDEVPKIKQVGFDTQNLVPSNQTPGNIEVAPA